MRLIFVKTVKISTVTCVKRLLLSKILLLLPSMKLEELRNVPFSAKYSIRLIFCTLSLEKEGERRQKGRIWVEKREFSVKYLE
jgi:hypothetical protein